MIPFGVRLEPGRPPGEQVAFAARRSIVSGQMRPGDRFPSVRTLSETCKINPNTAHKVITQLIAEGLLAVQPGIGTVVVEIPEATETARTRLLEGAVEQLVVEARRLRLSREDVQSAVARRWDRLESPRSDAKEEQS